MLYDTFKVPAVVLIFSPPRKTQVSGFQHVFLRKQGRSHIELN